MHTPLKIILHAHLCKNEISLYNTFMTQIQLCIFGAFGSLHADC